MTRDYNSNGTLNSYTIRADEVKPDDRYGYKIIAVVDSEVFWSAYRGLTDWADEQVAAEGDKISQDVAEKLFPSLASNYQYYD